MPAAAFTPVFDIRGTGNSYTLFLNGQPRANRFYGHEQAALARDVLARRLARSLAPVRIIACMCCKASFKSTGKANRLCHQCKRDL